MPTQIQVRRDTQANWEAENPILAEGEIGFELDNDRFKIGDGVTAWDDIEEYFTKGGVGSGAITIGDSVVGGDAGGVLFQASDEDLAVDSKFTYVSDRLSILGSDDTTSEGLLLTGFSSHHTVDPSDGFAGVQHSYPLNLGGSSDKYYFGVSTSLDTQGSATNPTISANYVSVFGNSTFLTGGGTLSGYQSSVDAGGGPWTSVYGARFAAFMGGSGAAGTENFTGVLGQAGAIHNGSVTNAFGGDFEVFSSLGSAGTLTMGAGVRSRLRINGGATFTDYRGVSISDWTSPSGGTVTNAYGLYIDDSIDSFGSSSRYAIRSLSTADSLFAGAVRGPINAYDESTWNGSTKFATEDAVRDKFESLGSSSVTGTGVADRVAMWTSASVLTNIPMTHAAGRFTLFNTATTDNFRLEMFPSTTNTGEFKVGDLAGGDTYIEVLQGIDDITVQSGDVKLGDSENILNGTYLHINDSANTFHFLDANQTAVMDLLFIKDFQYQRSLAGSTGNTTINLPYGSAKLAAGQTSLVVTNSVAETNSLIFLTPQANDLTAKSFSVTRANGSFTITANAATTANIDIAFMVTN